MLPGREGGAGTHLGKNRRWLVSGMRRIATFALPEVVGVLLLAGCGSFEPGTVSPLAGTWYGATRNPGNTFAGKIVFDFTGDLVEMDISSPQQRLFFEFDGQVHGSGSEAYSATARTSLTGDTFVVKAQVEYTEGKFDGLTYITVGGTVRNGSIDGTLEVAFPDNYPVAFDFDASRQ